VTKEEVRTKEEKFIKLQRVLVQIFDTCMFFPANRFAMFGNDQTDPATKEDFQSGVFELPANKPVWIRLSSMDVIHGF